MQPIPTQQIQPLMQHSNVSSLDRTGQNVPQANHNTPYKTGKQISVQSNFKSVPGQKKVLQL